MIYLYGLNVTIEELRSKSYIHGRPWKSLEGLPVACTKVDQSFQTFLFISCSWAYTWSTLFNVSQFGKHLKAQSSPKDQPLSAQLSPTNSPLDYGPGALKNSVKASKTKKPDEYLGMLLFIVWHLNSKQIPENKHHTWRILVNPSAEERTQWNCSRIQYQWNGFLSQKHCYVLPYSF